MTPNYTTTREIDINDSGIYPEWSGDGPESEEEMREDDGSLDLTTARELE